MLDPRRSALLDLVANALSQNATWRRHVAHAPGIYDVCITKHYNSRGEFISAQVVPCSKSSHEPLFVCPGDTEEAALIGLAQLVLGDTAWSAAHGGQPWDGKSVAEYISYRPSLAGI